jgi:hypothetical protein
MTDDDNYGHPTVDASLIGDIVLGESHYHPVGLCEVAVDGKRLVVTGEGGRVVDAFWMPDYQKSAKFSEASVYDLEALATEANKAIAEEYGEL